MKLLLGYGFFEELRTAGLLYPHFRLGYDAAGQIIDRALARLAEWRRAVFAAMSERFMHPTSVINVIPTHRNSHGFTCFDPSHVQ